MKKIVLLFSAIAFVSLASAQTNSSLPNKSLVDRAGDHFMIQLSSDHWTNEPDSISGHQKGFSRGLNIYLMFDKPFKTNPKWSVAFGVGVGSSNIFFKQMNVGITNPGTNLRFDTSGNTFFKKYKLATSFLEAPVELRYTAHPEKESKSLKFALGAKIGIMLDAHTKGKNETDKNGTVINAFTQKESKTIYFNTTRLMATGRVGYGNFSLFGAYQLTSMLKDGAGADMKLLQIGLCISGL